MTSSKLLTDIGNLPSLEFVSLNQCQFDPDDLRHLLASKVMLDGLFLFDTPTSDDALKHVGQLTNLTMLGLSRTKVTSAGMAHLSELGNLRYLALGGTAVGDEAIDHLAKLKSLRKLEVVGKNGFTEAGRQVLQRALPKCVITFREPAR